MMTSAALLHTYESVIAPLGDTLRNDAEPAEPHVELAFTPSR